MSQNMTSDTKYKVLTSDETFNFFSNIRLST